MIGFIYYSLIIFQYETILSHVALAIGARNCPMNSQLYLLKSNLGSSFRYFHEMSEEFTVCVWSLNYFRSTRVVRPSPSIINPVIELRH